MRPLIPIPLVLLFIGCSETPRPAVQSEPRASINVTTIAACTEDWPSVYLATGTVRARTSAVISSKSMAYIREMRAQTGDHVREGQLLVSLDARDLDTGA